MGTYASLTLFSVVIVLGALAGAWLPLRSGAARLLTFLAFAAGIMLGAAFFHMLPEAFHGGGFSSFTWVPVGFVFLFLLERFVLVHACEEPPDCAEHAHNPALGLTAFLGLAVHTLFDGVALGSSILEGVGLTAFIAITAHKIPSSLSLASILKSEGRRTATILLYVLLFSMMVPLGAVLAIGLDSVLHVESLAAKALAFSAGTFLYIAVSDLLPHVNRHGKQGRLSHILGMAAGLALMFALTFVTGHGHGVATAVP
jgi:zinc and cadmium transporter